MVLVFFGLFFLQMTLRKNNFSPKILKFFRLMDKPSFFNTEVDVNENLPPYWNCLSGTEQKKWYSNEVYMRNSLQIATISNDALERLRTSKNKKKHQHVDKHHDLCIDKDSHILGTCNYDILNNDFYASSF